MKISIKNFWKTKIHKMQDDQKEAEDEKRVQTDIEEEEQVIVHPTKRVLTFDDDQEGIWEKIKKHRRMLRNRWVIFGLVVAVLVAAGSLYLNFHVSRSYSVLSSEKRTDINGTKYERFGNNLLKYSPDGVSCLSDEGNTLWSSTFSIQSPLLDICDTTAVIGEEEGTQVYIYNSDGQIGQFQTLLPIEKIRVAKQGVVAVILEDTNSVWINFYDSEGELIAENRTSLEESGYPLDIALSPDGMKMMVSFLKTTDGNVETNVSFYNFDSIGQANVNNLVNTVTYENIAVPEVRFINDRTSVAFRGDGFSIYKGREVPEESANVTFEEEILSVFYDDEHLGFVFQSDEEEHKYLLRVYNMNGRRTAQKYFDFDYKEIRMDEGKILMIQEGAMAVFTAGGRLRAEIKYEKPIENALAMDGFAKYMILTQESTDKIRLK